MRQKNTDAPEWIPPYASGAQMSSSKPEPETPLSIGARVTLLEEATTRNAERLETLIENFNQLQVDFHHFIVNNDLWDGK